MREVGDGFSEEGTEVRTWDKEKLVTWCTGETAAAPAVRDHDRRHNLGKAGAGGRMLAEGQGSRPEALQAAGRSLHFIR